MVNKTTLFTFAALFLIGSVTASAQKSTQIQHHTFTTQKTMESPLPEPIDPNPPHHGYTQKLATL